MNGWVKLHRSMLENIELNHDSTAKLLFIDLLLMSNSKGEIGKSTRDLAKKTGINHSTLRKALERLQKYQMIQMGTHFRTHKYTHILICNWSKYQSTRTHYGAQTGHRRDTDGTQTTGVPRIKNKNKNSGKPDLNGSGYRKAKEIAERIKQKATV